MIEGALQSFSRDSNRDKEAIRSVVSGVERILSQEGVDEETIKRRVTKFLTDQKVPFIDFVIERDNDRTDGRDFFTAYVHVPNSWPSPISRQGTSTILCTVPDTYESDEHP